ncbi:hypothetical protein BL253_08845 [Pseudofrankia asymbiotica]|uniref:Uncharacterized protein n=1 Tax=Pseudofrankia asymbiotica TaxID=1834516 RepID=A0A1V2IDV8_9ACTN|nr:hypothetical protein BL253_08845 [Pseudofrankia asymbiotica]
MRLPSELSALGFHTSLKSGEMPFTTLCHRIQQDLKLAASPGLTLQRYQLPLNSQFSRMNASFDGQSLTSSFVKVLMAVASPAARVLGCLRVRDRCGP